MVRVARGLLLCIATIGASVGAQPRPRSVPQATVARVVGVTANNARTRLRAHQTAIVRCIDNARSADPSRLALLRWIDATLVLDRDGTPASIELSPPIAARGLSACLAETLFSWTMPGPLPVGASVVVRIELPPAAR